MPHSPRCDASGSWHHVMNRAIARRTAFETEADVRYFNRGRKRDGPLFRGRFLSRPVRGSGGRAIVLAYIDSNPVEAHVVGSAADYPNSSRHAYTRDHGPIWLSREWVEAEVCSHAGADRFDPADYDSRFPARLTPRTRAWVEDLLERGANRPRDLTNLIDAAPERVRSWMRRKLAIADGTQADGRLLPGDAVERTISALTRESDPWVHVRRGGTTDLWSIARAGLLRELGGLAYDAIAIRVEVSRWTARDRCLRHRILSHQDPAYADRVATIVEQAVDSVRQESRTRAPRAARSRSGRAAGRETG